MIIIEIIKDKYQYQDLTAKDLPSMCRMLKERGLADQAWEAYRGDMLCLYGSSTEKLAQKRLIDDDTGMFYRKYYPHGYSGM